MAPASRTRIAPGGAGHHLQNAPSGVGHRLRTPSRWVGHRFVLGMLAAALVAGSCARQDPPGASSAEPGEAGEPAPTPTTGAPAGDAQAPTPGQAQGKGEAAPAAGPAVAPTTLYVISMQPQIYAAPNGRDRRIGYLRRGAKVPGEARPVTGEGCAEGWYRLAPYGFVCGRHVTLDANNPEARARTPNLEDALPYPYAHNMSHGTPLYKTPPSRDEMASYEPYLGITPGAEPASRRAAREEERGARSEGKRKRRRKGRDDKAEAKAEAEAKKKAEAEAEEASNVALPFGGGFSPAPPEGSAGAAPGYDSAKPWWAQSGKDIKPEVTLADLLGESDDLLAKRMVKGFYVSVDRTFTHEARTWHKTLSGLIAPADRMAMVKAPSLSGQVIDEAHAGQAVAFVLAKEASKYAADADAKSVRPSGSLARYDRAFLTGKTLSSGGKIYRETADGWWLRGTDVAYTQPGAPPADLAPGEKWVDVNLARQTLVAFEGTRPVFATLVSSGRKGADKEHDHKTPTGTWRVREKHVAATMDGDGVAAGDLPYSIEDVPFIMYYFESYALHGAFWHDNFGRQQSHGCVNLAPLDAKRIFLWSDPPLPAGWHGVQSSAEHPGSRVVVHD